MPTVLTHPAVASLRVWAPSLPTRVAAAGAALSILPDLDVVAFALDIPYSHPLGHRGFSHSFVFAALTSLLATLALCRRPAAFAFLFVCAASHPVLDAMTSGGGLGVAFFAPFSNERYFLPWRPIRVSPIGPRFFSALGLAVLASEVVWVWLPLAALTLLGKYVGNRKGEAGK
jgi:inner membrane protein